MHIESSSVISVDHFRAQQSILNNEIISIFYSSAGFISFIISFIMQKSIDRKRQQLNQLQTQQVYSIDELYEHLIKQAIKKDPNIVQKKKKKKYEVSSSYKKGKLYPKEKYFIQGIIGSKDTIPSLSNKSQKLIYSEMSHSDIYNKFDSNLNRKEIKVNTQNNKYYSRKFELLRYPDQAPKTYEFSTLKNNYKCEITNFRQTNIQKVVQTIYDNFTISQNLNLKTMIFAGSTVHMGYHQKQLGISIGDSVMVYGKLVWDLDKKLLKFDAPEFFVKSKDQLKQIIKFKISYLQVGVCVFSLVGAFFTYKFVKQMIQLHRERKNYRNMVYF